MSRILRSGLAAAVLSGVPSTAWALLTRADPFAASVAAGSLLLPHETRRSRLLASAAITHLGISLGWAAVLSATLPRRHPLAEGAVAGLVIAGLDLGLIGSRLPRIRSLSLLPQLADHLAYGVVVATVLARVDSEPAST